MGVVFWRKKEHCTFYIIFINNFFLRVAFLIPIWPIFKQKLDTNWLILAKISILLYQIKLSKGGRREHFRVGTFVTEMLCRKKIHLLER